LARERVHERELISGALAGDAVFHRQALRKLSKQQDEA